MSSAATRPNLLPVAAFVSLLVLLLGATGLFALHLTNVRTTADLARLDSIEQSTLLALRTRAAFKTQVQEWKNILLRGRDAKDLATYRARFEAEESAVRANLEKLAGKISTDESAPQTWSYLPSALIVEHHELSEAYHAALAAFAATPSDPEATFKADAAVRGLDRPLAEKIDALASEAEKVANDELAAMSARAAGRYEILRRITWIVASFAVLASLWLCFRAARPA